jgi:hypothetical protein
MRRWMGAVVGAAALIGTACGSSSPAGPSSAMPAGVTLQGTLLGGVSGASVSALAAGDPITVFVESAPEIQTTIAESGGAFTLRGLPEGGFTLVFRQGTTELGRLDFAGVLPNQQITITVQLTGGSLALMDERRNGIGHGDVEIEGRVEQVVAVDPAGESRFVIRGYTVVARPGETSIREGNKRRSVADVTVGRLVHVKGVWLEGAANAQPVLAHEIKLQDDSQDGDDDDTGSLSCQAGQKAEVEGLITAKGAADITVRQQGKGDYLCTVSGTTPIRKGNRSYTFAELQTGWRVHVKGTVTGLVGSACGVSASEVKVQQD